MIFNVDTIRPGLRIARRAGSSGTLEVFRAPGEHWSFVEPQAAASPWVRRCTEKVRIGELCSTGLCPVRARGGLRPRARRRARAPVVARAVRRAAVQPPDRARPARGLGRGARRRRLAGRRSRRVRGDEGPPRAGVPRRGAPDRAASGLTPVDDALTHAQDRTTIILVFNVYLTSKPRYAGMAYQSEVDRYMARVRGADSVFRTQSKVDVSTRWRASRRSPGRTRSSTSSSTTRTRRTNRRACSTRRGRSCRTRRSRGAA